MSPVTKRASAGERPWLVAIEQLTDGQGSSGAPIETWTDLPPCAWMSKTVDTGAERSSERYTGDVAQLAARTFTEWRMPYRCDMDPDRIDVQKTRRLVFRTRVHDIVAAELLGSNRQIRLLTVSSSKVP